MTFDCLLVTDLDGTLLGDEAALQEFHRRWSSFPARMGLVYASGRLVEDVRAVIADRTLISPDAIIGGVGTQISSLQSPVVDWCRPSRREWCADRIRTLLSALQLQPEKFQTEYKVSFFLHHASTRELQRVAHRLAQQGIHADLIYSSQRDLDVVPSGINKGAAARYLARRWCVSQRHVIVCGDSGNDRSLFAPPFRGVVVANAHEELRQLIGEHVYLATGKHAAGVLEGLDYWLSRDFVPR